MEHANGDPAMPVRTPPDQTPPATIGKSEKRKPRQFRNRRENYPKKRREARPLEQEEQRFTPATLPDMPRKQGSPELNILLAKLSAAGNLGNRIKFSKTDETRIEQLVKNKPLIEIEVNRSQRHRPYHFKQITFTLPNGTTNTCEADYLFDTKTIKALNQQDLGQGPGWKTQTWFPDWKSKWRQGEAVVLVRYGDRTVRLSHTQNRKNTEIEQIQEKDWHTALEQKLITGATVAAGAAATAATAYYTGHYGSQAFTAGIAGIQHYLPAIGQQVKDKIQQMIPYPEGPIMDNIQRQVTERVEQVIKDKILPTKPKQEETGLPTSPSVPKQQQTIEQQIYEATTNPRSKTIYDDQEQRDKLYWIREVYSRRKQVNEKMAKNRERPDKADQASEVKEVAQTWAVLRKAIIVKEVTAPFTGPRCRCRLVHRVAEMLGYPTIKMPDIRHPRTGEIIPWTDEDEEKETISYYKDAIRNPETGKICQLTGEVYEELYKYFDRQCSERPYQDEPTDLERKMDEAKKEILRFANTQNGKQGMIEAITFNESIDPRTGLPQGQPPNNPNDISGLNSHSTRTNGIKATACLIAIRSIEDLLTELRQQHRTPIMPSH
jgi:hypothetical protein